jgi:hypothetical protein
MSASTLPLRFLPGSPALQQSTTLPLQAPIVPSRIVRRRPDMQQGRALEVLGHSIEYLIDSRMFLVGEPHTPAEADAVQILSRCSREVFATCAEVVPVHQRFKQWAAERLRAGSHNSLGHTSARS